MEGNLFIPPTKSNVILSGNTLTNTARITFNMIFSPLSGPIKVTCKMLWRQKVLVLLINGKGRRKVRGKKIRGPKPMFLEEADTELWGDFTEAGKTNGQERKHLPLEKSAL